MWKETVRALQTGALAEVAVVAFVVAFVLVVAYAFTLRKATRDEIKRLPLDDAPEFVPRDPEPASNGRPRDADHA